MSDSASIEEYLVHAEFRVRHSPSGIGAAVVRSSFEAGERVWTCIISDVTQWHYIRVLETDPDPRPNFSTEAIEEGIERFATTLPAQDRLRELLNVNPLHADARGNVSE